MRVLQKGAVWSVILGLCVTSAAKAVLIADLRNDYDTPAVAHTNGQSAVGKIPDTLGTGNWTFFGRQTAAPGGAQDALLYNTSVNSVRAANAYAMPAGYSLDLPAISNANLITPPGSEGVPAANELAFHTGDTSQTRQFLVARWTAGAGSGGIVNVGAVARDLGVVVNGVQFQVFNQAGATLFGSTNTVGNNPLPFNINTAVTTGGFIDFTFGPGANYFSDQSALSVSINSVAAGIGPVVNGSFEQPTAVAPGNNFDTVIPTGWGFTPSGLPYVRVGSGGFGYPAAANGTTIYGVEGDRGGVLFQDLGTMIAGETYTFNATISSSTGTNSYRASLISDPLGLNTELDFITQADFNPGAGASMAATFAYTATLADQGRVLRLALSDNGTGSATRSAFDAVSVTVTAAAAVPEPASIAVWSLLGIGCIALARRFRRADRG